MTGNPEEQIQPGPLARFWDPDRWLPFGRLLGLGVMLFLLGTFIAGTALYIRMISADTDRLLHVILSNAWTPANVRAAAEAGGLSVGLFLGIWVVISGMLALVFGGAGVLLFWRRPGWFGVYLGVTFTLIGTQVAGVTPQTLKAVLPTWGPLLGLLAELAAFALFTLPYVFPDGRFVPAWTRWPALGILLLGSSEIRVLLPVEFGEDFQVIATNAFILYSLIGLGAQVYRYWRVSGPRERQQTKWPLAGFGLILACMFAILLLFPNGMTLENPPTPGDLLGNILGNGALTLASCLFVVGVAVAILRYRLYEIDLIIRRTLIYGLLTSILALVYFGSVLLLQTAFRALTGEQNAIAVVVSTLTMAALFNPLRTRIQGAVDRRFYRQKYDSQRALDRFNEQLRDEVDPDHIQAALLSTVRGTLQPERLSLWVVRRAPRQRNAEIAP